MEGGQKRPSDQDEEQHDQERNTHRIGRDQQRLTPRQSGRDHEEDRHCGYRIEDHDQGDELVEEVVEECRRQAAVLCCCASGETAGPARIELAISVFGSRLRRRSGSLGHTVRIKKRKKTSLRWLSFTPGLLWATDPRQWPGGSPRSADPDRRSPRHRLAGGPRGPPRHHRWSFPGGAAARVPFRSR